MRARTSIRIGSNGAEESYFLKAAIAELILVKVNLSDADVAVAESHMKTRYALP